MHLLRYYLVLGALLTVVVDIVTKAQECDDLVPLIMGSQYRVTDNQITASTSLNRTHLPKDARLPNGSAWCSEQLGLSIHDPWLQVNFGADIVIHTISISGSSFSHVTSFQIQSAVASIKELQYLTVQGSESPHLFNISSTRDSVTNTTLATVLVAERLRILPHTWDVNPPCLRLEVYGCLHNQVCISEVGLNPPNVLLPAENVVGPSQQMFAALLIEGMSACFNYTDKQLHVTLNFTQPILITRATSLYVEQFSDGDRSETAYVNTYSISTSADNEHFTTYTDTTGRTDILTDQTNTFWEPIQTDRYLRLAVTNVTPAFGIVCWHLQLYGCVAPQATTIPYTPATPTPILTPEEEEDRNNEVRRDYLVLQIAAPIGAVTIFIVVVVCVVGVAIGVYLKRTVEYKLRLLKPSDCVRYRTSQSQLEVDTTIKVVHNMLYSSQETSPDRSECSGVTLLQSVQSGPPTAAPGQYEIPIDTMKRNRPPLGYTSVQFTPHPTILGGIPTERGDHDYESVKFTRSTTESVEAIQRSLPDSQEPGYELMESARHGDASTGRSASTLKETPVQVDSSISDASCSG